MQTLGSVIDQLIVVNLKIWHKLDEQYNAKTHEEISKAAMTVAKLNEQRNVLIDEYNQMHKKSVQDGDAPIFESFKSYGRNK